MLLSVVENAQFNIDVLAGEETEAVSCKFIPFAFSNLKPESITYVCRTFPLNIALPVLYYCLGPMPVFNTTGRKPILLEIMYMKIAPPQNIYSILTLCN